MNKKLILEKSRLEGKVEISGAKNSVLKLMAASILTDEKIIIHNYPYALLDAQIHEGMLNKLGKKCSVLVNDTLIIEKINPLISELQWDDRSIRNSLGALTTRTGGCNDT